MFTKRLLQVISISLFFITCSVFYAGNLQGSEDNFIKFLLGTWSMHDDSDNLQDTGDDFGSGLRQDDSGNLQDTGDDFGNGWRQDDTGNLQDTGDDFGNGWRQDDSGNLQDTGDNSGSGEIQE